MGHWLLQASQTLSGRLKRNVPALRPTRDTRSSDAAQRQKASEKEL